MNAHVPIDVLARHASDVAAMLKLLANPQRLLLLCRLRDGECAVGELIEACALSSSTVSPSGVSQHLARLRDANVVATRREGTTIYYTLASDDVRTLIDILCERFGPKY